MSPTCCGVISNPCFKLAFPDAPAGIPRGNLLEIAVNPYNGQTFVNFQRSDAALTLVDRTIYKMTEGYNCSFPVWARSLIEAEPRYVLQAVV